MAGLNVMVPGFGSQLFAPDPSQALPAQGIDPSQLSPDEQAMLSLSSDYLPAPYMRQPFPGGVHPGLLESLAGLQNTPLGAPHSFSEGLLYGLGRGIGTQGSRAAQARAQFEADQTRRQALSDQERLQASRDSRQASGSARREIIGNRLKAQQEQKKFEQDNPLLPSDVAASNPMLARIAAVNGGRVPISFLKPEAAEPLQGIIGPNGKPVLVPRSQAVGKQPANSMLGSPLGAQDAQFWAGVLGAGGNVPLGRGGVGSPAAQSIARAAMTQAGGTPQTAGAQIPGAKASLQAGTANLSNLSKARGMTTAQVSQLEKNSNMLLGLQKKLVDTGVPVLNQPLRSWVGKLGSSDQAAYGAALTAVQQEAARVQGANYSGAGQIHQSDKDAIRAVISGSFNGKQMQAVLGILNQEGKNRVGSLDDAIKEARKAVNAPGSGESSLKATHRYDPTTGTIVPVGR